MKKLLGLVLVMVLWVITTSQIGDVGIPTAKYFNSVRCDSIAANNIVKFNRVVCIYWHRGIQESSTVDWNTEFSAQYTVQGTIIDCPDSTTSTTDTIVCPWQTEAGLAWILNDDSNYMQREVCE